MNLKASKLIFESESSLLYKGNEDGKDVIIKLLKDASPSADLLLKVNFSALKIIDFRAKLVRLPEE